MNGDHQMYHVSTNSITSSNSRISLDFLFILKEINHVAFMKIGHFWSMPA